MSRGNNTPKPFKMTLDVTHVCNSRCRICNVWKLYQNKNEKLHDELDASNYSYLFRSLSPDIVWLTITGGEPFLKPDFVELLLLAKHTLKNLQIIELTTNGLDPELILKKTEDIIETLPQKRISLGVSLDGLPSLHNFIRGRKDAWKKATTTFRNLQKFTTSHPNLRTHLSYTITRHNAGNLETFYQKVKDHLQIELKDISIAFESTGLLYQNYQRNNPLQNSATENKTGFTDNALKDIKFLTQNINRSSLQKGLLDHMRELFYTFYLSKAKEYLKYPRKMMYPCSALTASFFIDPYGHLFPCITWNKKIGNIMNKNFSDLWNSQLSNKTRFMIKQEKCPVCWTPCEAQPSFVVGLPRSLISEISRRFKNGS